MSVGAWTQSQRRWCGGAIAAVGVGAVAFPVGQLTGLAGRIGWFDAALHTYNSGAIALLLAVLLGHHLLAAIPGHRVLKVAFITSLTVFLGVGWEIAEWVFDMFWPTNLIAGKDDTMVDLLVDTVGALVGALVGLPVLTGGRRRDAAGS